jgi:rhodanese-related sulfurtransferase
MTKEISSPEELMALTSEGAILIDVRSSEEYDTSKIPNVKTGFDWNSGEFHDRYDDLDPENTYILICRSGSRSMHACQYMESLGFSNLYNLKGGMLAWTGETE